MVPRLQAEEGLAAIMANRAGDAFTDEKEARRLVAVWEQALKAAEPRPRRERLTAEQFAQRMRMLGMAEQVH